MRKKVIKAHQGMAHVPKPSASKAKGTAGTTPRPKRRIGLPQRFRGGRRRLTAPAPQAPPTVRPTRAMPEPAVIQQPNFGDLSLGPVVRPPRQSDAGGGRGGRPVFELPNMGRGKPIQRPKPQSFRVPAVQMPKSIPKRMQPRIMNQGGYVSRAKYGIVDNLKGK